MREFRALSACLLLVLSACSGRSADDASGSGDTYTAKVPESTVTLPASGLPEFKTDPHVRESQGNQISGVVRVMLEDRRGRFWFGTQDGLARYDGAALVYFDLRDAQERGIVVRDLAEDDGGNLWIGHDAGLTRYDGRFFTTYTEGDGLLSDDVWRLTLDGKGSLWIATTDGVCRYDGDSFVPFPLPATRKNPNRGVSSPRVVWWITEDRSGTMWFAAEGRVYTYDGNGVDSVSVADDRSETHVNCILEDRKGNMWFATAEKGLIRLTDGKFTSVTDEAGSSGVEVGHVFEDSSGYIWFPVEGLGVCRYDGAAVTPMSKGQELSTHATHRILEDRQGRIWSVGWLGAYRLDGGSWVNVTRDGPW